MAWIKYKEGFMGILDSALIVFLLFVVVAGIGSYIFFVYKNK